MQPSSDLCRAQEARHNALASTTTLDNVRRIASAAAAAWAKEGQAADIREDRRLRARALAEAQSAAPIEPPTGKFLALSETPDRGHADWA